MAGKLGSYPDRDSPAQDVDPLARESAGDPLAELARLIGQGDPHGEPRRHDRYASTQAADGGEESGADWAEDDYAVRYQPDNARYVPPADRRQADPPPAGGRFFSGPATQFNGFRGDPEDHSVAADDEYYGSEEPPPLLDRPAAFASGGQSDLDDRYEADEQDAGQAYAASDYDDEAPRQSRRGGLVVVIAVLGLAVLGTAGAFGYRSMFGASMLPTLPPIIKAATGPNKIMPSYGEAQTSNSSDLGGAGAVSTEKLVKREEPPVDVPEAPKAAPRVVSVIPIPAGPAAAAAPSTSSASAATVAGFPPVAVSPSAAPSTPMAAAPSATGATGSVSTEPKRIHTVVIRSDQFGGPSAAPVEPPTSAAAPLRSAVKPAPASKPSATALPAGANGPLPLVPSSEGGGSTAPARARAPVSPMTVANAEQATGTETVPSPGGYTVQLTSQRSEAEAKSAFQALRAKFPDQLGGREPIVRRADLGAKGIYYRALVGPFASMEEAAGMCSSLKAAGGNCLVQKN